MGRTRESWIGMIQVCSTRGGPSVVAAVEDGPRSIGRARRWEPLSMSRQTLWAIRYSQARSASRASRRSAARQARIIVSWTASSASEPDPSIR